jgi:hypothetical protein
MAKKEMTIGELVDRLLEEEPEKIKRFLEVVRTIDALELDDPDLLPDWLNAHNDEFGNVNIAADEIAQRVKKYQILTDALAVPKYVAVTKA